MKREDILDMSRKSNKDEGIEYTENQGRRVGFLVFISIFAVLVIFNFIWGEKDTFYAMNALLWALLTGEYYGKYLFDKSKWYLFGTFAAGAASILSVIAYIKITLG